MLHYDGYTRSLPLCSPFSFGIARRNDQLSLLYTYPSKGTPRRALGQANTAICSLSFLGWLERMGTEVAPERHE